MAGSKKASKELKLEEKLKRALVPAEEQPYEPDGQPEEGFKKNIFKKR